MHTLPVLWLCRLPDGSGAGEGPGGGGGLHSVPLLCGEHPAVGRARHGGRGDTDQALQDQRQQ